MGKQKRDSKITKSKIIQQAKILFAKKGYDATTTDDIAKKAKINKALIFYYFQNKSNLYNIIMNDLLNQMYEDIIKSNKQSLSIEDELFNFIKTYATYTYNHPHFAAILLRELSDSGAHIPEIIFSNMRKLFGLLSEILQKGEQKKIFKKSIPIVIHFMITGSINLMITTEPLRKKAKNIDTSINTCPNCDLDEVIEYIFKTIKTALEV